MSNRVFVLMSALAFAGCATTSEVDPRDDSFFTSARCALSNSCQNYTDRQASDLSAEQAQTKVLETENKAITKELQATEAELSALKSEVSALDDAIAALQAEAETLNQISAERRPQIEAARKRLEDMRVEARSLQFEASRNGTNVSDVREKLAALEKERDELEALFSL